MDLYNYTYLYANGYLKKFRDFLNNPGLTYAGLSAILKTLYKRKGYRTYDDGRGNTLYAKNDLEGILHDGISKRIIQDIFRQWDKNKAAKQEWEPIDYSSDEEDMQKVSDKLVYDDNYGEVDESMNKNTVKRIIISEEQERELKKWIAENYFVETDKVNVVRKYLDDNFTRGANPVMGEDGYPSIKPILGLKINGMDEIAKAMSPSQVFYMLQDKFKNICSNIKERDSFLKQILIDWYNKKISNNGMLSKNWV